MFRSRSLLLIPAIAWALLIAPAPAAGGPAPVDPHVADGQEQACVEWLERALTSRGFALEWVERTAADGPSIVDAAPSPPRPSNVVAIAVRGETAHVVAPFLRYAQARRLVARAAGNTELPFRCAIASEVAIASAEESRLRVPLLLIAMAAIAVALTAIRRTRPPQNAK